ncbi:MAG: polyhydroxyalkanoate synthesis regulator DNA-binding domain-containing protein [Candidatus Zixiibacteriota bacterium]
MVRLIKRYTNRRLYDTQEKRPITHRRVKELLEDNHEFRIVDTASGRDVTVEVLGRIVSSESAAWSSSHLAREKLGELIKQGGEVSMSILRNTILASIGAFNVTKKKAEEVIDQLIESGEVTKSQRKEAVLELLQKADKSTEDFRQKVAQQAGRVGSDVQKAVERVKLARRDDLDKLSKKFEKLQKAVDRIEKKLNALNK